MDYSIAFLITTFNRNEALQRLVKKLKGDIFIIDDGSDIPVKINKATVLRQKNKGKQGYYETVSDLWAMPQKKYDYYIMLPDDFMPIDNFVEIAINTWKNIRQKDKICLNLFTEQSRYMKPCWTNYIPVDCGEYIRSQWVDLCFLCEEKFFREMRYRTDRTYRDWNLNPELGSGVGSFISKKLHRMGFGMYQVKSSLFTVQPEGLYSKMNMVDCESLIYKTV